jgi:uncharacterized protein (DUF4415 family)
VNFVYKNGPVEKSRVVQEFSAEYLAQCQKMSSEEILNFLDQFRRIHGNSTTQRSHSKLISMKVPEDLLYAFKAKAKLENVRYQSQIKELMRNWLSSGKD